MKINKREYIDILLSWPVETIQRSMLNPSRDMLKHPVTIALHGIAIRRKVGRIAADFILHQPGAAQ